eukprot:10295255-Lingulodinium_polyedra.AAC.1
MIDYVRAIDPTARHAGLKLYCEDQRFSFPATGQEAPVIRVPAGTPALEELDVADIIDIAA